MPTVTMTSPVEALQRRLTELEQREADAIADEDAMLAGSISKDIVLYNRLLLYIDALEYSRSELLTVCEGLVQATQADRKAEDDIIQSIGGPMKAASWEKRKETTAAVIAWENKVIAAIAKAHGEST